MTYVVDDFVQIGPTHYRHKDGVEFFTRAGQSLQELLDEMDQPETVDLRAYAAERRWKKETAGFVWDGVTVPSDDRAKLLLLGAAQTLADDAVSPLIIKGQHVADLTGAQFRALNEAHVTHVQATFETLALVLTGIGTGKITTPDQVDEAFA